MGPEGLNLRSAFLTEGRGSTEERAWEKIARACRWSSCRSGTVVEQDFRIYKMKTLCLLWLNVGDVHLVPVGHHLVGAAEDGTRTRTVRLADQAFTFHHVEDCCRAAVADAQSALQHRRRGTFHLNADTQRFFK